ncbi:MAG: hypothetical protein NUW37_10740 [Planctomycetes bacterium]|nr:hypothetical protein [Planctomycetota bacterium]
MFGGMFDSFFGNPVNQGSLSVASEGARDMNGKICIDKEKLGSIISSAVEQAFVAGSSAETGSAIKGDPEDQFGGEINTLKPLELYQVLLAIIASNEQIRNDRTLTQAQKDTLLELNRRLILKIMEELGL